MSENFNSSPRRTDILKTFAGRSSSTLQDDESSPTSSPGTIRKKNTFFGSLRYTKKKNKSIEILRSQESFPEDNEPGLFLDQKAGDAERIRLLKSVKEGRMSIEEAMKQAEELGVNQNPSYQDISTEETIFNFGIYKYTKNRASCSRRILQFDFQEKVLCTIQKGSRGRKFEFSQIRGFDSEDGVRFDIYFEDYHDYELDADTVEEKNKICTLLESIVQQNKADEPDGVFEAPLFVDKFVIKEGLVEKKGHSAAFMMWPRRWLRVQSGELSYFKIGEENQSALNIIKLGPGQADVKKIDHNGFVVTTSKKEYSFRVIAKDPQSETRERDEWISAITEGSQPLLTTSQRKSRGSSIFQDPVFTSSIQEQEKYIKDVVKTLQRELEQLTSVLSVVNAPIQATIQVKKVKEVVSKMDTHVKTGLLSWTMRQMKNRSDSSTDLQTTPVGSLSRQSSTKSIKSQGGPPITPINEGYETIAPPARPPKTPDLIQSSKTPDVPYTYDSIPPRQPISTPIDNTAKCPLSGRIAPQQPPRQVPRSNESSPYKDCQVLPYETVNISPSSQSPSSSPSRHPDPSSIYQQPTSNKEVRDGRFDAYDNVNIKNVPVSTPSITSLNEVDANTSHETDAGGMGCQTLDAAVKERKELYTEEDQSGVVLLKVTETQGSDEAQPSIAPPAPPLPPSAVPPPPPPPPGMSVPPPPPPIGGLGVMALDSALPVKKAAKPKTKLRPFFWNKVPLQMVTQSMWLGASDRTSQLNLDSLEEMFQMEEKEKEVTQAAPSKPTTKMLLDPKKAHNLGIFLSGFRMSAKEIDEKLGVFKEEEGALPIDHVIALKRFLPTPEEQEMYKNIKEEDIPGLLQEDKFMIKLCEIPDLDKRLDLLLVVMEFPSQFEELAPAVGNVLDACHKVYSSQRFQVVLEYVLAIGNYINGGTNRGGAYGFRLTTLPKMADIRSGKNRKNTLLKYLLTELQRCCPDALMFLDDLKTVPKAADASIKGLSAEVEVMRKDLQKIKKHSNDLFLKYKRTEAQDVKLVRDVDTFVLEYEEKLKDLSEKCKEMKYIYSRLLTRFGEAANTDSEELFTALGTFLNQVKKTLHEAESGPSDKKRIKLDILNDAIAARMARTQSQDQIISSSTSPDPTQNGCTDDNVSDIVDGGKDRKSSSDSVEDEARNSVSDLKAHTSPFKSSSPNIIHKQLSVKNHSPKELLARPTKQGYLDKLSGGKHKAPKWDNRFFELAEGGHLHYYKKADGKIINTIYLRGCPVVLDEQDPSIIRIKTDDRDWSLKAPTDDEAKEWKECLEFYAKKTSNSM